MTSTQQRLGTANGMHKHGMYKSRIYRIWDAMKQRCLNSKAVSFRSYGAKGITIDPSWHSFSQFLSDMGSNYADDLTLDRIDGTKGYSKNNCRWATRRQQSANLKNNVLVECNGVVVCASECARRLGVNRTTVLGRIYKGKMQRVWKTKLAA